MLKSVELEHGRLLFQTMVGLIWSAGDLTSRMDLASGRRKPAYRLPLEVLNYNVNSA